MFPYNIVEQQGAELIRRCGEKNIGFIDMKPLAGGAIEDGTLALRYVCSNPDVTITIPGMAEIRELEENQKACENQEPLTKEEEEKIQYLKSKSFCLHRLWKMRTTLSIPPADPGKTEDLCS